MIHGPRHEERLLIYAAGETSPVERLLMSIHLAFCAECRNRLAHTQATTEAFRRVLAPLRQPSPPSSRTERLMRRFAIPGAVGLLIGLLTLVIVGFGRGNLQPVGPSPGEHSTCR